MEVLNVFVGNTETRTIHGEGGQLWGIIIIDEDDSEDSTLELWRANDEDHLYEQFKVSRMGYQEDDEDDDDDDEEMTLEYRLDQDWGFTLLPQFIGNIELSAKELGYSKI